jgi:2,4-dienoyl-CoA reductase (NADPH2)
LLYSYDSRLNDRYYEYFRARARGGAGIVTVGPVGVDFIGSGLMALSLRDDQYIPDFQKLTGIIRAEGARAFIQLFHAGGYSHPILIDGQTPIGPSAVYNPYAKVTPREMTPEDIDTVQEAFAAAAARAVEAGFDGVEIIASASYLLTQFLSPAAQPAHRCLRRQLRKPHPFPPKNHLLSATVDQVPRGGGIPYTAVGDTIAPGKLNDAIHGGFLAALAL